MKTNWKKLMNPDYLGAYSLDDGNGKYNDIITTIQYVKVENVTGPDGKKEDCAVAHFSENIKPMILNATNMKVLEKLFKSKYIEDWAGRKIQLYVASVKAFGDVVDALRIRPKIPQATITATKCADCSKEIQGYGEHDAAYIAGLTYKKYGKQLCSDCATKAKAAEDAQKISDPLAAPEKDGEAE